MYFYISKYLLIEEESRKAFLDLLGYGRLALREYYMIFLPVEYLYQIEALVTRKKNYSCRSCTCDKRDGSRSGQQREKSVYPF